MQPSTASEAAPDALPTLTVTAGLTPEQFAHRHAISVYRFASLVSRKQTDAEDLAQEALLRAMRSLARYDPRRGPIEHWLWRIVVNAARDAGRLAGRTEQLLERLYAQARAERLPSAEAEALARIGDAELLKAVRDLPRRQRTLLALRFGADLEFGEVGALLGQSQGAVKQATYRALAALRRRLEAEGHD
jgi:RNA polymerase sigma factor (sigma-70 family)